MSIKYYSYRYLLRMLSDKKQSKIFEQLPDAMSIHV